MLDERFARGCLLTTAIMLAACGGGGDAESLRMQPTHAGEDHALPALPTYTLRLVPIPLAELQIFPAPGRPSIINEHGQFVGTRVGGGFLYDPATDSVSALGQPDPATFLIPQTVSDSGLVAGTVSESRTGPFGRGFAWRASIGAEFFTSSAGVLTTFASGDDRVPGSMQTVCGSYAWAAATGMVTEYPAFCARWMNAAGLLLGTSGGQVATLAEDGVRIVNDSLDATPRFITDDETVFVQLNADSGELRRGAAVIRGDTIVNVGLGVVSPPADDPTAHEHAELLHVSARGHAIGTVGLAKGSDDCRFFSAEEWFYWTADEGTAAIRIGGLKGRADHINRDGIVVGRIFDEQDQSQRESRAFIWTKSAGGALLETRVSNLPADLTLVEAQAIGDGGHILAFSARKHAEGFTPLGWALLTPAH